MSPATSSLADTSVGRRQPLPTRAGTSARYGAGVSPHPSGVASPQPGPDAAPSSSPTAAQLQRLMQERELDTARGLLSQMIIQMGGAPQSTYKGMYVDKLV